MQVLHGACNLAFADTAGLADGIGARSMMMECFLEQMFQQVQQGRYQCIIPCIVEQIKRGLGLEIPQVCRAFVQCAAGHLCTIATPCVTAVPLLLPHGGDWTFGLFEKA